MTKPNAHTDSVREQLVTILCQFFPRHQKGYGTAEYRAADAILAQTADSPPVAGERERLRLAWLTYLDEVAVCDDPPLTNYDAFIEGYHVGRAAPTSGPLTSRPNQGDGPEPLAERGEGSDSTTTSGPDECKCPDCRDAREAEKIRASNTPEQNAAIDAKTEAIMARLGYDATGPCPHGYNAYCNICGPLGLGRVSAETGEPEYTDEEMIAFAIHGAPKPTVVSVPSGGVTPAPVAGDTDIQNPTVSETLADRLEMLADRAKDPPLVLGDTEVVRTAWVLEVRRRLREAAQALRTSGRRGPDAWLVEWTNSFGSRCAALFDHDPSHDSAARRSDARVVPLYRAAP